MERQAQKLRDERDARIAAKKQVVKVPQKAQEEKVGLP